MSNSPDDFASLKQLLAAKRYEQPPPGYFNDFSDRVISRIEAEDLNEYSSWWQWLIAKFDARPVLACVYGLTVSGLLLAGFTLSESFESQVARNPVNTLPWLATTPASSIFEGNDLHQNALLDPSPFSSSIDRLLRNDSSHLLFNGPGLQAQPISFPGTY